MFVVVIGQCTKRRRLMDRFFYQCQFHVCCMNATIIISIIVITLMIVWHFIFWCCKRACPVTWVQFHGTGYCVTPDSYFLGMRSEFWRCNNGYALFFQLWHKKICFAGSIHRKYEPGFILYLMANRITYFVNVVSAELHGLQCRYIRPSSFAISNFIVFKSLSYSQTILIQVLHLVKQRAIKKHEHPRSYSGRSFAIV